jgi:hypothetical protein
VANNAHAQLAARLRRASGPGQTGGSAHQEFAAGNGYGIHLEHSLVCCASGFVGQRQLITGRQALGSRLAGDPKSSPSQIYVENTME